MSEGSLVALATIGVIIFFALVGLAWYFIFRVASKVVGGALDFADEMISNRQSVRAVSPNSNQKKPSNNSDLTSVTDALDRAAKFLLTPAATADISRRLNLKLDEVALSFTSCVGVDQTTHSDNQNKSIAMYLPKELTTYLSLSPSIEGVNFAWTLGLYNDKALGPVPVLFLATRYRGRDRVAAQIWVTAKTEPDQRQYFFSLGRGQITTSNWDSRGTEGGLHGVSRIGFIVERESGGLDLMSNQFVITHKMWNALYRNISHNGVARVLQETAPLWPYPTDLDGDSIFNSPAGGGFSYWF
jgi:hypothetical protein